MEYRYVLIGCDYLMIQLQVLNYVLQTKDILFITKNNLTSEYFSDYKDEYNYIIEHYNRYQDVPDKLTFIANFKNFDFIEVNESKDFLLNEITKDLNKRNLIYTFNRIRDNINSDNIDDALYIYQNEVKKIKFNSFNSCNILSDLSRYDSFVNRQQNFDKFYVKTGFDELDSLIGGWDRKEELATIAGRPGQGKSWILLKTAVEASKQGLNVGIYSGEMSLEKVSYRIDTLYSHISNHLLLRGDTGVQPSYKNYLDALKTSSNGRINILTPNMIGDLANVSNLRSFIENDQLDMLCIDQHSLLEDERKAKTPVERASNISRDLKNLQVFKKIPIISVSQQNRSSTEDGVSSSNIAQSDRIAQDSTTIIFCSKKDNDLSLHVVKSRDAVSGKVLKYNVDMDRGSFNFIPDGNDETIQSNLQKMFDSNEDMGKDLF